ncbi:MULTISPECIES: TIGR04168 family protein [unclassified Leptolyngbya]|uniref:TIGR04168 family protein n=1 Tax=unclassified Leptolyngbya TaxID=2650499 RepID=UPI0016855F10|nr:MULTISPECIES: TIGR04168 family protein [unclassified Leptolyngbya]MBD1910778.1 TIGR04168 family protein [Leptolyngbya sp. FACHB-8]MBD2158854.1 TIGR04168 family protein [Leptolyngbya sp. FACHB-16]
MNTPELSSPSKSLTLAVVGDVHDQWEAQDERALKHLGVDLVLLVGDFGNESVEVVEAIAHMSIPKAVILGNHDAWYTATEWGRQKCPYDRTKEDRVQRQLDLLGPTHVGYGVLDFPELGISVVGGRPFSWGGSEWKYEAFYRQRYQVHSMAESTERIIAAAAQATQENLIFIGHCGPFGLGDAPEDPCGRDWNPLGGDFGDPDLAEAIAHTRSLGKHIPLVTFGHMHHNLRHRRDRLRRPTHLQDGTFYLNAAAVPRIIEAEDDCFRNFSLVTLKDGVVSHASMVWINQDLGIKSKQVLYFADAPAIAG